jgi:hypothetical protein
VQKFHLRDSEDESKFKLVLTDRVMELFTRHITRFDPDVGNPIMTKQNGAVSVNETKAAESNSDRRSYELGMSWGTR